MSGRTRLIATVAIVLVVCLLFYVLFVRGKQSDLSKVQAETRNEQARTVSLQAQLQQLKQLQAHAPQLQAELSDIRKLVPKDNEVPNFIFQTQEAANQAGVSFLEITPELPKQPPEGAALAEVRITIGAQGGYFAVQDFIRRLYGLPRALRIDNIALTGTAGANGATVVQFQATARVFYELPTAAPPVPVAPGAPATPAPVVTPTP
jgi:Tfp pilus assembly protein PilO